jgi:hypothetical protein
MSKYKGIKIDEPKDDPDYDTKVIAVLKTIEGTHVGAVIMKLIRDNDQDMTIVPYTAGDRAVEGECNAYADPDRGRDAAPRGINYFIGRFDNPKTPDEDERYDRSWNVKGTSKGSDVHVHFSPDMTNGSSCGGGKYGSLPDEVLVHEMVHALREMEGRENPYPTEDGLRGYDNEEEWLAVVISNIYISAKYQGEAGKDKLRADHHGFHPLKPPLNSSVGFLADAGNNRLLNIYYLTEQPLFSFVGAVPAAFNPFRALIVTL